MGLRWAMFLLGLAYAGSLVACTSAGTDRADELLRAEIEYALFSPEAEEGMSDCDTRLAWRYRLCAAASAQAAYHKWADVSALGRCPASGDDHDFVRHALWEAQMWWRRADTYTKDVRPFEVPSSVCALGGPRIVSVCLHPHCCRSKRQQGQFVTMFVRVSEGACGRAWLTPYAINSSRGLPIVVYNASAKQVGAGKPPFGELLKLEFETWSKVQCSFEPVQPPDLDDSCLKRGGIDPIPRPGAARPERNAP